MELAAFLFHSPASAVRRNPLSSTSPQLCSIRTDGRRWWAPTGAAAAEDVRGTHRKSKAVLTVVDHERRDGVPVPGSVEGEE